MAVTEAGGGNRFKAAAPMAAAGLAVVAAIAGGTLLASRPKTSEIPKKVLAKSDPAPQLPAPGGGGLASVQFDQTTPGRPAGAAQDMEIVVKFKDDSKVKDIIDAFWKDQAGGS